MKNYLVGINYFAGWWRGAHSGWLGPGYDWRLEYPERIPALGCFSDLPTMEAEIDAASEHGVDFFQMLWYVQKPPRMEDGEKLNRCFDYFRQAKNRHKMKFVLEFCQHPPFEVREDELWADCVREWIEIMKDPCYLRIEGRPVFKIHGLMHFYAQYDKDLGLCRRRIDWLRQEARKAGLGELIIGAGVMAEDVTEEEILCSDMVDYLTTYADFGTLPGREEDYPYEDLERQAAEGRLRIAGKIKIPYVPFVMAGWNPRPWKYTTPIYRLPDEKQWRKTLETLKVSLEDPRLQIRKGVRMFTVYAWNEYGEGGFMAPTLGEKTMKLDVLRDVFGGTDEN